MAIARDSQSYPFLAIAQRHGQPYSRTLALADLISRAGDGLLRDRATSESERAALRGAAPLRYIDDIVVAVGRENERREAVRRAL